MVHSVTTPQTHSLPFVPQIVSLRIKNYRVLHDLELRDILPLIVFLGPNGSGKSTIFDVFAFLSECFSAGLHKAWDKRCRFKELRHTRLQLALCRPGMDAMGRQARQKANCKWLAISRAALPKSRRQGQYLRTWCPPATVPEAFKCS